MSRTVLIASLLVAGSMVAIAAVQAAAQPASKFPDFSSNQAAWQTPNGGEFIAVPGSPAPLHQDPAHPFVGNGQGRQPTYRIADLAKADNLKQWAKDAMKKDNDEVLGGKIAYTARQSCKPGGVPGYSLFGGPFYFLQTPKEVTMLFEGNQEVRHVYLDAQHSANPKPSWYGESVGHYEGDMLVVDTIGLNNQNPVDNYRTPHSEKLHVVERYRLIDEGKTLELLMTIDDSDTYNQPWQAIRRYRQVKSTMAEEICAEGNFLLFDYGVPVAKTSDF